MSLTVPARNLILAIVTAVLGLGLALAMAPKANATEVLPADGVDYTEANATLQDDQFSWFIPDNAYFDNAVGCEVATADFLIPPSDHNAGTGHFSLNQNKPMVGDFSDDHGGVISDLADSPTFDDCDVYELEQPAQQYTVSDPPDSAPAGAQAETFGDWTVSARNNGAEDPVVTIGVPPSGAELTIGVPIFGDCVLDITPDKPQSVFAEFVNGDTESDAELLVDSQIKSVVQSGQAACDVAGFWTGGPDTNNPPAPDDAIAQYEADYEVTSPAGPVQIVP